MERLECKGCHTPIQEYRTGKKKIDGEIYCRTCYYDELGKVVENSPIGVFPEKCSVKHH